MSLPFPRPSFQIPSHDLAGRFHVLTFTHGHLARRRHIHDRWMSRVLEWEPQRTWEMIRLRAIRDWQSPVQDKEELSMTRIMRVSVGFDGERWVSVKCGETIGFEAVASGWWAVRDEDAVEP